MNKISEYLFNNFIDDLSLLKKIKKEKYLDYFYDEIKKHIDKTKPVVFLMGLDEVNFSTLENAFVVYLGHHGDISASIADIILPTPAYTEKSSTYMNIEGRVIQTTKCHNPLGEAKEEWKIFRVLSDLFEKDLNFNNLGELRNELTSNYGQFALLNEVNSIGEITFAKKNKIENIKINYNIENFYMNDSISRSSETMARCTKDILNKAA